MQPHQTPGFSGTIGTLRMFGVPLRLHFTFVLLLIFLLFIGSSGRQSAASTAIYLIALFVSVILHELGHALAARRYGIRTLEIVMYPIGGVSRLARMPKPREELPIAIAGPLVNLILAVALGGWLAVRGALDLRSLSDPNGGNLLARIAAGNLILAAFNLLPAFPMDGGRILRAALGLFKPEREATRIAAKTGQALALAMGLYGLLSGYLMLVVIALFVYLGAVQESAAVLGRTLIEGAPVSAAMVTDFRTLSHGQTIRDAAEMLLATTQQDFPVVHGEQVLGLLGRNRLLRAMASEGPESYVAGAMDRDFVRLSPRMDLSEALPKLTAAGPCALVMEDDRLVGLLTMENLSEFLLLRRFGLRPPSPASGGKDGA